MKKILIAAALVLSVGLVFAGGAKYVKSKSSQSSGQTARNESAIRFTSTDLDGNAVTEKIFNNSKITMVNIWATYCGPCINEMPDLGKLYANNKSKGVAIVGVVGDVYKASQSATAKNIIKSTGANYLHIVASSDIQRSLMKNVDAVPTTIFVDSNGHQIGNTYIGSKDYSAWQKIIDSLLK